MTEKTSFFRIKFFLYIAVLFGCAVYSNAISAQQYIPAEQIYKYAKEQNFSALRYAGYSIDSQAANGDTALCMALAASNTQAYHTLLKYGANPNARCVSFYNSGNFAGAPYGSSSSFLGLSTTGWAVTAALVAGGIGIAAASGGGSGGSKKSSPCAGYQKECLNGYIPTEDTCTSGNTTYYKCIENPCDGYVSNCESGYHMTGEQCRSGSKMMYKCAINQCDGYQQECTEPGYEWSGRICQTGDQILYECVIAKCAGYKFKEEPENCAKPETCQSGDITKYKCDECEAGWTGDDCKTPAVCPENFKQECDKEEYIGSEVCPSGGINYIECKPRDHTGHCTEYYPYADKCTACEDGYVPDNLGYCVSYASACLQAGYLPNPGCDPEEEVITDCPYDASYHGCERKTAAQICIDKGYTEADITCDYTNYYLGECSYQSSFHKCIERTNKIEHCAEYQSTTADDGLCKTCQNGWTGDNCNDKIECSDGFSATCTEGQEYKDLSAGTCQSGNDTLYICKPYAPDIINHCDESNRDEYANKCSQCHAGWEGPTCSTPIGCDTGFKIACGESEYKDLSAGTCQSGDNILVKCKTYSQSIIDHCAKEKRNSSADACYQCNDGWEGNLCDISKTCNPEYKILCSDDEYEGEEVCHAGDDMLVKCTKYSSTIIAHCAKENRNKHANKCNLCDEGWDGDLCNHAKGCGENYKLECNDNEYQGSEICQSGDNTLVECNAYAQTIIDHCDVEKRSKTTNTCLECHDGWVGAVCATPRDCGSDYKTKCEKTEYHIGECKSGDSTMEKCSSYSSSILNHCDEGNRDKYADKCNQCHTGYIGNKCDSCDTEHGWHSDGQGGCEPDEDNEQKCINAGYQNTPCSSVNQYLNHTLSCPYLESYYKCTNYSQTILSHCNIDYRDLNDDKCSQCDTGYAGIKCETCAEGYNDDDHDGTCQPDASATCDGYNYSSDPTGNPAAHCQTSAKCATDNKWKCTKCVTGYIGEACDSCDTGYHPEDGSCVPDEICPEFTTEACSATQYISETCSANTDYHKCANRTNKVTNCAEYQNANADDGQCKFCEANYTYIISDNTCVHNAPCLPQSTVSPNCADMGSCRIGSSDGYYCKTCNEGYNDDDHDGICEPDTSATCDGYNYSSDPIDNPAEHCQTSAKCADDDKWKCTKCATGYTGEGCDSCDIGYHPESGNCVQDETVVCKDYTTVPCDNTVRYISEICPDDPTYHKCAKYSQSILAHCSSRNPNADECYTCTGHFIGTKCNDCDSSNGWYDDGAGGCTQLDSNDTWITTTNIDKIAETRGSRYGMHNEIFENTTKDYVHMVNKNSIRLQNALDTTDGTTTETTGMYMKAYNTTDNFTAINKHQIIARNNSTDEAYGMHSTGSGDNHTLINAVGGTISISQNTSQSFGMSGASAINKSKISMYDNSGDAFGMFGTTRLINDENATITISNLNQSTGNTGGIYGMYANSSLITATNNGNISIINNTESDYTCSAYGMYSKYGSNTIINNGTITMSNNKRETINAMYGKGALTNTFDGTITLSNNTGTSYGIYTQGGTAEHPTTAQNLGTITLDKNPWSTGMYADNLYTALINGSESNSTAKIELSNQTSNADNIYSRGMYGYNMSNYADILLKNNNNSYSVGMHVQSGASETPSTAQNLGTITLSGNKRNVHGMYATNQYTTLINGSESNSTAKIELSNNTNTDTGTVYRSYGMRGYNLTNYASISLSDNSTHVSHGMYAISGGTLINATNATINLTNNASYSYGIFAESGTSSVHTHITNNGTITIDSEKLAFGIYADGSYIDVVNNGTISVDTPLGGYGIYAIGSTVTVKNTGKIIVNGTECTGADCATTYAIILENGAHLQTASLISAPALNLSSIGGKVVAMSGAKFEVENALSGDLYMASDVVADGFDDTYTLDNMVEAGDVADLNLISQSALFDATLQNNTDAVMTKKAFDEVVNNSSVAKFLEQNYAAGNNEDLFNLLKKQETTSELNSIINTLTGAEVFDRFNFEDMTMMRELNMDINNKLFNDRKDHLTTAGAIAPFYFDGGSGSNGRYALYNTRIGRRSYGLSLAFTNVNGSDRHDENSRKDDTFQISVPIGYNRYGFRFITAPRFGYAYGTYDRNGYQRTYDGTVEKRMFGLSNEVRYPIEVEGWSLAPAAEFNMLGYHTKGHEDAAPYALKLPSQENYSVEAGLGLYLNKDTQLGKNHKLSLNMGVAAYHEFADPYRTELEMQGMSGRFKVRDSRHKDNRMVLRSGFDYHMGDSFSLIGTIATFIDGTTHTNANLDLKYYF